MDMTPFHQNDPYTRGFANKKSSIQGSNTLRVAK